MGEERIKLPVRSALIPVYYKNFHCLAQDCRDSCCDRSWRIAFSKKDYLAIKRAVQAKGLAELAEQSLRRLRHEECEGMYAEFRMNEVGHCAFHTPEGLCRLQLECGQEVLPLVCRDYPRRSVYTPAAKEYSLSPSCEGVLQQLWDLPEGVEFVEDPLPRAQHNIITVLPGENLQLYFAPIRALCIDILQNRAIPFSDRMLCLGIVLQNLRETDWRDFDPDVWTGEVAALTGTPMLSALPGNRDMYLIQNFKVLDTISGAENRWTAELYEKMAFNRAITITVEQGGALKQRKSTVQYSKTAYADALEEFRAAFSDRGYFFENLMVAVALYLNFPELASKEALWRSYVSLCNLYSFYRFVSVVGCKGSATKEQLFHMIVMASRAALHNRTRLNEFQKELFQNDSSTLAHMAILING